MKLKRPIIFNWWEFVQSTMCVKELFVQLSKRLDYAAILRPSSAKAPMTSHNREQSCSRVCSCMKICKSCHMKHHWVIACSPLAYSRTNSFGVPDALPTRVCARRISSNRAKGRWQIREVWNDWWMGAIPPMTMISPLFQEEWLSTMSALLPKSKAFGRKLVTLVVIVFSPHNLSRRAWMANRCPKKILSDSVLVSMRHNTCLWQFALNTSPPATTGTPIAAVWDWRNAIDMCSRSVFT